MFIKYQTILWMLLFAGSFSYLLKTIVQKINISTFKLTLIVFIVLVLIKFCIYYQYSISKFLMSFN